jgi:hypothetical protein
MPAYDKQGFNSPENTTTSGLILLDKILADRNGFEVSSR